MHPPEMAALLSLSAIEFPGVLRNPNDPSKAIAALGGEEPVRAALSIQTPGNSLTLNLRPHPTASRSNILSERPYSPTNLFLLRVTTGPTLDLAPAAVQHGAAHARVVGHVTSLVRFRTLADFQYHVHRSAPTTTPHTERHMAAHAVFEALVNYPKPSPMPSSEVLLDSLRPRRFARTQPEYGRTDYFFKQYACTNLVDPHSRHLLVPGRPLGDDRRSDANRLSLLHHRVRMDVEQVPQQPEDADSHPAQRGREAFGELFQLLSKLFHIRPIWVRRALYEGIPSRLRKSFKKAIAMIAYSFQGTGPFYQAWIRYGYDPRKDPAARKYQVIEIRINNAVINAAQTEQYRRQKSEAAEDETNPSCDEDSIYPEEFRMPPSFTLTRIPKKKNNFIQVCDIKMENVIKVCENEEAAKEFDPKFGFFTEAGHLRLTTAIKETFFSICEQRLGAERAKEMLGARYSSHKKISKKRKRLHLKDVMKPQEKQSMSYAAIAHPTEDMIMPSAEPYSRVDTESQLPALPARDVVVGEAVAQVADLVEEASDSEASEDEDDNGQDQGAEVTEDMGGIEGFEILGEDGDDEESDDNFGSD